MATKTRKAVAGPTKKHAQFHIDAALFEELGERLVSKPEIALAELVKNAYDADSPTCRIQIGEDAIVVEDKGHGLTEEVFLNHWMVVSTQDKGKRRFSPRYGRSMAGSKGVGRFSARFLGNELELISVARDKKGTPYRLSAKFNWKAVAEKKRISSIRIPYSIQKVSPSTPNGTKLRISNLRENVRDIAQDQIRTDILKLVDPAGGLESPPFYATTRSQHAKEVDPGFAVTFGTGEDKDDHSDEVDVARSILDAYLARVRIVVEPTGVVDLKVYWRDRKGPVESKSFSLKRYAAPFTQARLNKESGSQDARGLPIALEGVQHLPLATELNSPVFIDLRFFPRRKGTFTNMKVDGRVVQTWLKRFGSFAVVDNKFVMPAYADVDSDWLGVESSKAKNERNWQSIFTSAIYPMDAADKSDPQRNAMLALPRMSQLIGRVHISTQKQSAPNDDAWLQPNMDRESLRANGAFNLLWHLSRFAVETIAHVDRKIRLKEKEKAELEAQQAARTALSAAISQIKKSDQIEPEYRVRVVEQLKAAERRLVEADEYQQDSRLSLEMMSLMGVMAGFMTHEFEKALGAIQKVARELRGAGRSNLNLHEVADRIAESEQILSNYLDYMRLFVGHARNTQVQSYKARAQIEAASDTLHSLLDAHGITLNIDVDKKMYGPAVPLAAYHGIIINLVSNAMKALVPKLGTEHRIIKINAHQDGSRHILQCADNGIGIPDYLRDRIWDPLFTTTTSDESNPLGSGLGLGLSVVQRVVSKLGGKIELLDEAPAGFKTAFRLSLPAQSPKDGA